MKHVFRESRFVFILFTLAVFAGCGGSPSSKPPAASTSAPPAAVPPNATLIPDIQKIPAWQSCTACTGNPLGVFSMVEGVASPSLSGSSASFSLRPGTRPFGAALWFKYLTADNQATHFVLDLDFYLQNPSAPQAMEFAVSQSTGTSRYNFAAQCDLANQRAWLVWNPATGWISSGVPCVPPAAESWNHLTWEFERDGSGHSIFKAVTLNGTRSEINISVPDARDSTSGIDVSFQADATRTATPYSVWLDKINLSYW